MTTKPTILDLGTADLEEILQRLDTKELSAVDCAMIRTLLFSYVELTELLKDKNTSLARLRKMLFGASTEKTAAVVGGGKEGETLPSSGADAGAGSPPGAAGASDVEAFPGETAANDSGAAAKGHGRNGADAYRGAEKIEVHHRSLQPGDSCPQCAQGTVYETARPGVLVRLVGQAPVGAKVYYLQKLRCHLCGVVFAAEPPEGVGAEKYDATVGSMIALLKYGSGMPFHRAEKLQESLGIPLPASTQWDIVHSKAEQIEPAFKELLRQAADGDVVHNDDTTIRILEMMGERAKEQVVAEDSAEDSAKKEASQRSGMFTTGIVSTREGRKIALFLSGRQHAGENLKDVLSQRAATLGAPIQMCDALSRNLRKRPG